MLLLVKDCIIYNPASQISRVIPSKLSGVKAKRSDDSVTVKSRSVNLECRYLNALISMCSGSPSPAFLFCAPLLDAADCADPPEGCSVNFKDC